MVSTRSKAGAATHAEQSSNQGLLEGNKRRKLQTDEGVVSQGSTQLGAGAGYAGGLASSLAKAKGKRRETSSFFLTVPLDILHEILGYLTPKDLLNVARTNTLLRQTLLADNAKATWIYSRGTYEAPSPPLGFSEPQWASFLFELGCTKHRACFQSCGKEEPVFISYADWRIRRRVCSECRKRLTGERDRRVFKGYNREIFQYVPSTCNPSHRRNSAGEKYDGRTLYWPDDVQTISDEWDALNANATTPEGKELFNAWKKRRLEYVAVCQDKSVCISRATTAGPSSSATAVRRVGGCRTVQSFALRRLSPSSSSSSSSPLSTLSPGTPRATTCAPLRVSASAYTAAVHGAAVGIGGRQEAGRRAFHATTRAEKRRETFKLADIGEGITECEVIKWSLTPGTRISAFDPLCEVQSDKASVEITSPFDGVVLDLLVKEGEIAKVGSGLCVIEVDSEEASTTSSSASSGASETAGTNANTSSLDVKVAEEKLAASAGGAPSSTTSSEGEKKQRKLHPLDPSNPAPRKLEDLRLGTHKGKTLFGRSVDSVGDSVSFGGIGAASGAGAGGTYTFALPLPLPLPISLSLVL
ncbi:hypothetical protein NMY22_g3427 [Coprinellus aureogranulatus]|nr:hypothetical protein NMY22_g3427 [Coprinellus aureogranulatus]